MKFYVDQDTKEVFAYEADGSQDDYIKNHLVPITVEEADEIRLQAQEPMTYAEKRQQEYPSVFDYIDGVVKGDQAQIDKYIADCLAVKTKYPKE